MRALLGLIHLVRREPENHWVAQTQPQVWGCIQPCSHNHPLTLPPPSLSLCLQEDVSLSGYQKHVSSCSAPAPLTAAEQELQQIRINEVGVRRPGEKEPETLWEQRDAGCVCCRSGREHPSSQLKGMAHFYCGLLYLCSLTRFRPCRGGLSILMVKLVA